MSVLKDVEPAGVLKLFEEISAIPRGSGNTEAICSFCTEFAEERKLKHHRDKAGNLVIWKEGSPGYEDSETLIIQGHLDMVCVKNSESGKNMEEEGLELMLENGIISADGTSLGADDGIAVAFALAILESNEISHPPLEVVLTADEETGMAGAMNLDLSILKGRKLLNLDYEVEGVVIAGCAGAINCSMIIPLREENVSCALFSKRCTMRLDGCRGGHSGLEIDKGRANAIIMAARIYAKLHRSVDIRMLSFEGGEKANVIPQSAQISFVLRESDVQKVCSAAEEEMETIRKTLGQFDPDIELTLAFDDNTNCRVFSDDSSGNIMDAVQISPNGVMNYSPDIRNAVQTSSNLGVIGLYGSRCRVEYMIRSSVSEESNYVMARLQMIADKVDGKMIKESEFPSWPVEHASELRRIYSESYKSLFGKIPETEAIHGGLECGIFAEGIQNIDCISYGPQIEDIHSVHERVAVDSIDRTWKLTKEILRRLK